MTKKKKYQRWRDIRARGRGTRRIAALEREAAAELLELDLRAIRELTGKTQAELGDLVEMSQSEVSRLEKRSDFRLSTLRRVVEALGGELEVVANFGDKRVRLRAA